MGMFFRLVCILLMLFTPVLASSQNSDEDIGASQSKMEHLKDSVESKFLDTLNTDSLRAL